MLQDDLYIYKYRELYIEDYIYRIIDIHNDIYICIIIYIYRITDIHNDIYIYMYRTMCIYNYMYIELYRYT